MFGKLIHHPAKPQREAFGHTFEPQPECWTARGLFADIVVARRGGEWHFINTSGSTVYGTGTQEDPFRTYADLEDLAGQVRRHVERMRGMYPSTHHPYRVAGCEAMVAAGHDPNA